MREEDTSKLKDVNGSNIKDFSWRPSVDESTKQNNLAPFAQWININEETYLYGPFDFATMHGRKTIDRISKIDWEILSKSQSSFENQLPKMNLSSYAYSYHINTAYHAEYHDKSVTKRMNAVAMYNFLHHDC